MIQNMIANDREYITVNLSTSRITGSQVCYDWLAENVTNWEDVKVIRLVKYGQNPIAYQVLYFNNEKTYGSTGYKAFMIIGSDNDTVSMVTLASTNSCRLHNGAVYEVIRKAVSE